MNRFFIGVFAVIAGSFLTMIVLFESGRVNSDTIFDVVIIITALVIFGPGLWSWVIKSFSKGTNSTEKD